MIYATIDTNVVVSALLKKDSYPGEILRYIGENKITVLLNEEIIKEYLEVLLRPKFGFSPIFVKNIVNILIEHSEFLDSEETIEPFTDKSDIKFYAITLEKMKKDTAYLVTGNMKHFPEKWFVIDPKSMCEKIREIEKKQ